MDTSNSTKILNKKIQNIYAQKYKFDIITDFSNTNISNLINIFYI